MTLFNNLLNEAVSLTGSAFFTYEPNDKTEVHVNYEKQEIWVHYYRSENHLLDPYKKDFFTSLHGMFGNQTTEQKFYDIINRSSILNPK